jgi:hypothetical protein
MNAVASQRPQIESGKGYVIVGISSAIGITGLQVRALPGASGLNYLLEIL